jgi:hypothetical protein
MWRALRRIDPRSNEAGDELGPIGVLKRNIRNRIARIVRAEVEHELNGVLPSMLAYASSSPDERMSTRASQRDLSGDSEYSRDLRRRLASAGVVVEERAIDVDDFQSWLQEFPAMEAFYASMGDVRIEKCLEHYVGYRSLEWGPDDVFVDVGASGSIWSEQLRVRGVKAYSLDLAYPRGINEWQIGGDAGDAPVPEGFADGLAAHCSFECFMGDADIRFVRATSRLLKADGRCVIMPLYLDDEHFILTSPLCDQAQVLIDAGAKRVWRDDEYVAPFSRHYSPEALVVRLASDLPNDLSLRVVDFVNLAAVAANWPDQRLYCRFMLQIEKRSLGAGAGAPR